MTFRLGDRLGVTRGSAPSVGASTGVLEVRGFKLLSALLGISSGFGWGLAQLGLGLRLDMALGEAEYQAYSLVSGFRNPEARSGLWRLGSKPDLGSVSDPA